MMFFVSLIANVGAPVPGLGLFSGIGTLATLALPYLYFTLMHSSPKGATWGKAALGLRLITLQGEAVSKTTAFLRVLLQSVLPVCAYFVFAMSLGHILSQKLGWMDDALGWAALIGFLLIMLGPYAIVFFNPQRQTLFDQICKTRVVETKTP